MNKKHYEKKSSLLFLAVLFLFSASASIFEVYLKDRHKRASDCRGLGLSVKALNELFVDKAHLALNDGAMFGKEGAGFMRLNVASPRSIIAEAMRRLKESCNEDV